MEKKKIKFSSRKEFKFVTEIGRGSYGRVALVIKRDSGRYYAAKFISRKVLRRKEIKKYVMNERNIMYSIRFTFTVYLEYFIQDSMNLYFILPVALGGNLDSLIKNNGKLTENSAKFYAAQIVLALEYLHYMSIIYRDLKPGNILLDHFGFIKLTDFGFSKILKVDRTYTMCGTAEYLAPEIILGHGYNLAADWWSFGVVIYELCTGNTPFYARFKPQLFNRITTVDYYCPNYFTDSIQMLLWNIFQLDIERRFGTRIGHGVQDIKDHDWFSKIHWLLLANRRIDPPYLPVVNLHISSQCPSTSLSME
ncbi:hypothetical protein O3M35_011817 [Rhynocoris fuscipes]|uniref:Uncharacterized protein n=1 Tax=Rhynocoris fuscipes TaxID=488301 RepID=A0AAW1CY03_9HEMI